MKIMAINAGSSSLKFSLIDMDNKEVLLSGVFERIGIEGSNYTLKNKDFKIRQEEELTDHYSAVKILMEKITELKIITSLEEIDGIGHRVVHGSDVYSKSVVITDKVLEDIIKFSDLAPLHNPANVLGIKAFKEALPNTPMVAVFDTAFHQTMEKKDYLYPVPIKWYEEYNVRKYGFHGTSHCYIAKRISEIKEKDNLRIISCHLGNGGSVTAIKDGKCIDTSMGFTPLAGIMMGSRSGDIDPSIIPYVMEKYGKSAGEVIDDLNKKSGFLGISEISNDTRDVLEAMADGNEKCSLAVDMFVKSVVKYIAQYYVELGGCDVIAFAAGIGENNNLIRLKIMESLAALGVIADIEANNTNREEKKISSKDSKIECWVIPTDEELMIAMDTVELIK